MCCYGVLGRIESVGSTLSPLFIIYLPSTQLGGMGDFRRIGTDYIGSTNGTPHLPRMGHLTVWMDGRGMGGEGFWLGTSLGVHGGARLPYRVAFRLHLGR